MSWSNINWPKTAATVTQYGELIAGSALFAIVAGTFLFQSRRLIRKALRAPIAALQRHPFLAGMAGASLVWVSLVAANDKVEGLLGQTAAAWVQAVGSVIAIVAAIIIDGGAARRMRDHQRAVDDAAAESRVVAILNAAAELRDAADQIDDQAGPQTVMLDLPVNTQRRLNACRRVLVYHLNQNVELNPGTLEGLALAEEISGLTITWAMSHRPFPPNGAPEFTSVLRGAAADLADIAADIARETARV